MRIDVTFLDSNTTETFQVQGNSCIVGRSETADVSLKRSELSRTHFRIDVEKGSLFVTDLKSANGISINGVRIPSEQRTPYMTFQTLDVLELITFTISDFDVLSAKASNLKTSTKAKLQSAGPKKAKPKTKQVSFLIVGGLTLLGIGVLMALKNSPDFFQSSSHKVVTASTNGPQKKLDPEIEAINFKEHISKAGCEGTDGLCEDIGLTGTKEGVVTFDGNLMVFVNLDSFSEEGAHRGFRELGKRERQEIILAKYGTHPELVDYAKEKQARRILIIGFTNLDDIVILESLLKVNSEMVPQLEYNVHENLFGQVFFSGSMKLYNRYMKKALQLYKI